MAYDFRRGWFGFWFWFGGDLGGFGFHLRGGLRLWLDDGDFRFWFRCVVAGEFGRFRFGGWAGRFVPFVGFIDPVLDVVAAAVEGAGYDVGGGGGAHLALGEERDGGEGDEQFIREAHVKKMVGYFGKAKHSWRVGGFFCEGDGGVIHFKIEKKQVTWER